MHRNSHLLFLVLPATISLSAQDSFELTNEDHRLINMTTLNFNICVQQNAAEQLDNFVDVKEIAGHAVNDCDAVLDTLREKVGGKMNTTAFSGLERHIKNRAIKKLLLQLMYEKSSRTRTSDEQ